jgi:hypothetical protein
MRLWLPHSPDLDQYDVYLWDMFIGPEPALGISTKIAREVIRGWTNRKHTEYWQSMDKDRLETF